MARVEPITPGGFQDFKDGKSMLALGMRGKVGNPAGYGFAVYGASEYGETRLYTGIYQRRVSGYNNTGYKDGLPRKTYYVRMRHSHSSNPRTPEQQQTRNNFADAMQAWHNLTDEQRDEIIKKARRANRRPHNFFISDYMRNHAN